MRYAAGVLAACAAVACIAVSVAGGAQTCLRTSAECLPRFNFGLDGSVSPASLPRTTPAPVRIGITGRILQGPPLALREGVLRVGRDVDVSVEGLPLCNYRVLRLPIRQPNELRRLEKRCPNAIVGRGHVGISIAVPGQEPLSVSSKVALLNARTRNGAIRLYALTEIRVPVPRLLVATVEIRRGPARGWTVRAKVPSIAGASGAITHFALNVGKRFRYGGKRKSFLSASCPDGIFRIMTPMLLFRNEARIPGVAAQTLLKGSLAVPCRPKG